MKLEDFKSVADERLGRIEMTPEFRRRIVRECTRRARPIGKSVWIAAVACLAIMVVSGTTLLHHMQFMGTDGLIVTENLPADGIAAQLIPKENVSEAVQVSDSILLGDTIGSGELSALEKPISIGEYSEGVAPAENAEGLWGLVDINGDWLVAPEYASVSPVRNMQTTVVRPDGVSQTIILAKH